MYTCLMLYRQCSQIPKSIKDEYADLRVNSKKRGRKEYWVTSAELRGLMDREDGGGIVFGPNFTG